MEKKSSLLFIFQKETILVRKNSPVTIPKYSERDSIPISFIRQGEVGSPKGNGHFWAEAAAEEQAPSGMEFVPLRGLYEVLGDALFSITGQAFQLMYWRRTTRYCSSCGQPLQEHAVDRAMECSTCNLVIYPTISPVIAVAIEKDGQLLLARSPHFPPKRYSILAGFVEPGENLEEAVAREVMEEVGIEIKNIHYFGSQPWAFPHSLMVGFTAQWKSGNIHIDEKEIEAAEWYTPENLPSIPTQASISGRLILNYLHKYGY